MKVWRFLYRHNGALMAYVYIRAESPLEHLAITRKIESGHPTLRPAPAFVPGPVCYRAQFIMYGPRRGALL